MSDHIRLPGAPVHLLGATGYTVVLDAGGAGGSRWNGLLIARGSPGAGPRSPGTVVYVRDIATGDAWSATPATMGGRARVWRDEAMVRFARRRGALATTLEVAVDPARAVEVRGVGIRNDGADARALEVTSYVELALNAARADAAHPAYSKMFVQTAYADGVLLAWRRKKDASEPDVWAAHALVVDGADTGAREHETDRARFIGRDGSLGSPAALQPGTRLSGTTGTVLDPIFSLRATIKVPGGATLRAAFVTAAASSRERVLALIHDYLAASACAEVFARAREASPRNLATLGIGAEAARRFQSLSGALLGSDWSWRAERAAIAAASGGAPVLWAKGISGDLPIVLVSVGEPGAASLAREVATAQRFWRARQVPADIVIINTATGDEAAAVDAALQPIAAGAAGTEKSQGAVFLLRAAELDGRLRAGLAAAACIVLDGTDGDLAAQARSHGGAPASLPVDLPGAHRNPVSGGCPDRAPAPAELEFWNGLGGFAADGREYVTVLADGAHTPAPWSHIIANPGFGFLVTATGGGYCWARNSQQNQITRWSNDAACDPPGEAFLLRDLDDGSEWSATASPRRAAATYVARFGAGYARFDARVHGIDSELTRCVAPDDPVQVSRLRIVSHADRARRIAVAFVAGWYLGPIGSDPGATTIVDADPARHAVFARNAWRDEFSDAVAFIACSDGGSVPRNSEDGRSALVATLVLPAHASAELLFVLGEGADRAAAETLAARYRCTDFAKLLDATGAAWDTVFERLQIRTPQRSLDLLVNRWLPYQVLACRLWARTAFYQASGAFGFRDQLQDVGALCVSRPDLVRAHLLRSASRQFEEGDVQHWWLPPSGKGVRTRIVDDRLWLPLIVSHYVTVTGDAPVLDERVPFLHGDPLGPGQVDSFFAPARAAADGTLYEHCARAIDASLATGVHGLPLMGTGDWNDGMNRVGADGKGESVWMGWFLARVIGEFAPFAERRGDPRASTWRDHVRALQLALETKAWDGAWYRRAFYDDGTPLGTSADAECRVESMAQSWAVLSGLADASRATTAMQAVARYLVRPDDGLVALFAEPFDHTLHDPGYIKGYPPGLRENGGQYTHGSLWSLIAFALLGDGAMVDELLAIFDPIRKSDTPEKLARYRVEPYVQCADVYSVAPHVGRGGWTWYSGSAGWTWRAVVEWVLGFRLRGDRLAVRPCVPREWDGFEIACRRGRSCWRIEVRNPGHVSHGIVQVEADGVTLTGSEPTIAFGDDGAEHLAVVTLRTEAD